ncbi:hypothetical protein BGU76_15150 [Clostridioides difficile]|nr:hypothetical protein BGU76_15150 [Clostridioides difficile]
MTTALAVKDVVLPAAVEGKSMSTKAQLIPPMTNPSVMIIVEAKTSSTKATMAEDNRKRPLRSRAR